MASSIVASSFTHVNPATSGAGTALGAAAAVDDVIVVFAADGGGVTATASCTGATCTLTSQKQQIGNDGLVVTTVFTGKVTAAGTPTIAVTSAGGNLRWDAVILRGLSSATAHAVTGGTFPADAGIYSASVTTTEVCALLNYWGNNSTDPFVSWLASATQLNHDTGSRWTGSAYLLDQSAGTYALGMNSNGSGSNRLSMITLALQVAPSSPTINTQPATQVAAPGATATLTVSATASGGSLTYQWQSRAEPSGAWSDIGGATSASYTTGTLSTADNGKAHRCNVTDANGTTTSLVAFVFLSGQNSERGLKLNAWAFHVNRRVGYPPDLIRKQARSRSTDQTAQFVFGDWFGFPVSTAGPAYAGTTKGGGLATSTETTGRIDTGTTRATGAAAATETTARVAAATSTGTGRGAGTGAKGVAWAATGTATGKAATTESKGTAAAIVSRGTGVGSATGLHGAAFSGTSTGTGTTSDSYAVASVRSSSATVTGGGAATGAGLHATAQSGAVQAVGLALATEQTARTAAGVTLATGKATAAETTSRAAAGTIKAAGLVADSYSIAIIRATFGTATGGGRASASGLHAVALQGLARAGGMVSGEALHAVALGAIVKGAGTVDAIVAKAAAWSGTVRGGGFADDSYVLNHIDYGRAPVGGRAFRLREAETARPHGAETERPAVISGNRGGNINTARPANRGGRRT